MSEKLTVIVPVYNGEDFILSCILQIKDQTFTDWKCIIVNDASTDRTRIIIEDSIKNDPRFQLINLEFNKGVSHARNIAMDKSNSDYIIFLDSDDTYNPSLFQEMIKTIEAHKSDYVICNHGEYKILNNLMFSQTLNLEVFPSNRPFNSDEAIEVPNFTLESFSSAVWNKIYRRGFLNENKLSFMENITRAEDLEFNIRAFILAKKISINNAVLYTYRTSLPSSSIENLNEHPMDIIEALISVRKFFEEKKLNEKYMNLLNKLTIDRFLAYFTNYNPKNQRQIMSASKDIFKSIKLEIKNPSKRTEDILRAIYDNNFDRYIFLYYNLLKEAMNTVTNQLNYYQHRLNIEDPNS